MCTPCSLQSAEGSPFPWPCYPCKQSIERLYRRSELRLRHGLGGRFCPSRSSSGVRRFQLLFDVTFTFILCTPALPERLSVFYCGDIPATFWEETTGEQAFCFNLSSAMNLRTRALAEPCETIRCVGRTPGGRETAGLKSRVTCAN